MGKYTRSASRPEARDDDSTSRCHGLTVYGQRCNRRLLDKEYCKTHDEQGEYERELEHAYAAHTAIW